MDAQWLKYRNPERFSIYRPTYVELFHIFVKDANEIEKTLPPLRLAVDSRMDVRIAEWQRRLKEFRIALDVSPIADPP